MRMNYQLLAHFVLPHILIWHEQRRLSLSPVSIRGWKTTKRRLSRIELYINPSISYIA
jgi:hypothetical protein